MDSALEHQADLSEGGPRFSEDLHPAGAVAHVVRRVVLSDELDLRELSVRGEQPRADLVDQVLDRAAVEFVEDPLDLVTNGSRSEKARPLRDSVAQIAVTPVHVHPNRKGPIGELGERRVIVARERRERAPRGLYEPHPFPTAPRGGDLSFSANGVDRDLCDRTVRSRRAEENVARAALACRGVERYLARGHSKRLHDGVGLDEAAAEE